MAWHIHRARLNTLVFLDESGASTNLVRLYGRSPVGERVRQKVPHGHWKMATLVAAVRLSGPLTPALFDGPMDADSFRAYVITLHDSCVHL